MRLSSPSLYACLCAISLAAACGKVKSSVDGGGGSADAPAAPDAGPDANPRGTVHVTVIDNNGTGAPVVNAPVVFFDPDGTMVADVKTDGSGQAQADVLPGATATAIWILANNGYQIMTITGVKPGDDLTFGYTQPDDSADGQFTVNNVPTYGGASSYTVYGPCGSAGLGAGAPIATLSLYKDCEGTATELVVVAKDANGALIASLTKTGVTYTSGGSISLTGSSYTSAKTFTGTYSNVPAGVSEIDMQRNAAFQNGPSASTNGTPSGTTLSLSLTGAPAAGTNAYVGSTFIRTGGGQQLLRQRIAGNSFTYGADVGANLLQWIEAPTLDVANQTLTQNPIGMARPVDEYIADTQYTRTVGQVTSSYEWIVFKKDAGPAKMPPMPGDVPAVNPTTTDTVSSTLAILIDSSDVDGYDAARQSPLDTFRVILVGGTTADTIHYSASTSSN
jgi:hypothetical protein